MKSIASLCLGALVAAFLIVPSAMAEEKEKKGKESDEKVALDQVPAAVKAAAEQAVKDIQLTEAEKETKKGVVIYELKGKVGDKTYEIKVGADAKVIKVKEAKKDDKEEDGDDDDDDDKDDKK